MEDCPHRHTRGTQAHPGPCLHLSHLRELAAPVAGRAKCRVAWGGIAALLGFQVPVGGSAPPPRAAGLQNSCPMVGSPSEHAERGQQTSCMPWQSSRRVPRSFAAVSLLLRRRRRRKQLHQHTQTSRGTNHPLGWPSCTHRHTPGPFLLARWVLLEETAAGLLQQGL